MAASAEGVRSGRAYVELGIDDKIQQGLQAARAKLVSFGRSVALVGAGFQAFGAGMLAPFAASVASFVALGSQINDISERTGVSAEAISELGLAAQLAGSSTESLEKGFRKMARTVTDAREGSAAATDALKSIGVSVAELEGLSPDQQFERIADGIATIEDPSKRSAVAMEIFGRGGAELIPILTRGSAGLRAMRAEAAALGVSMSGSDAKAADALGDAFDTLKVQARYLFNELGASIAPALTVVAERTQRVVAALIFFARENRQILATVAAVAAGIFAFGTVLVSVGATIAVVGFALGGVATAIGVVGTVVSAVGTALAAVFAWAITPIGLVTLGLVGLSASAFALSSTLRDAVGSAVGWVVDRFGELASIAGSTLAGIRDAMLASNLTLAAQVLWAGLEAIFLRGRAQVVGLFVGMASAIAEAWVSVTTKLTESWAVFTASISAGNLQVKQSIAEWGIALALGKDSAEAQLAIAISRGATDAAVGKVKAEAAATVAKAEADLKKDLADIAARGAVINTIFDSAADGAEARLSALIEEAAKLRRERDDIARQKEEAASKKVAGPAQVAANTAQSVLGAFNASRLEGLGVSTVFVRIADTTKRIADDVAGIRRNTEDISSPEFGD